MSFPPAEPIFVPLNTFTEVVLLKTVRISLNPPFSRFSSCFSDWFRK